MTIVCGTSVGRLSPDDIACDFYCRLLIDSSFEEDFSAAVFFKMPSNCGHTGEHGKNKTSNINEEKDCGKNEAAATRTNYARRSFIHRSTLINHACQNGRRLLLQLPSRRRLLCRRLRAQRQRHTKFFWEAALPFGRSEKGAQKKKELNGKKK